MPNPTRTLPRLLTLMFTSAVAACDPGGDPQDADARSEEDPATEEVHGPSTLAAPVDPVADLPNCCEGHATPGCEDAGIEECVCAADPYCCSVRWDDICAGQVESLGCGSCSAPSCCETRGEPGCGDSDVEQCVCDADPYCCGTAWDSLCVAEIETLGCGSCEDVGSCCETHATSGCEDAEAEACVCDEDPYCCSTAWDSLCVAEVESLGCGQCGTSCGTDEQVAAILSAFEPCDSGNSVGQSSGVAGVTCEQVCCAFGFAGCEYRGAQVDYDACNPTPPPATGDCDDVFQASWSSQCVCTN
jgi:hypothetical protein